MNPLAAAAKDLLALGLTAEQLVAALDRMEQAMYVDATRPVDEAAQRRREKDRERKRAAKEIRGIPQNSAEDAEIAETLPLPSSPQTPQLPTPARGEKTRVREEGPIEAAFNAWNDLAKQLGLPLAKSLTADRRRSIKARLDEAGEAGWREALEGVRLSGHCQGRNDREWRADIDFVCQPKSFNRLREGFYGRDGAKSKPGAKPAPPTAEQVSALWDRRVAEFRKAWVWNEVDWGPKPNRSGCKVAPEILAKHGYGLDQGAGA